MVGVPGRSKGCRGCRRRKKACSLTKPTCESCKRLNDRCDYDRDTIFISVGESSWKQATYSATGRRNGNRSLEESSHVTPTSHEVMPLEITSLTRIAFREQLLSKYLQLNDKNERPTLASWLSAVPSISSPQKALETSAYAICTSRLGQLHNDPILKHESLRLYTMGVKLLHSTLRDPARLYDDETLGACIALALYEILEGERETYSQHADGAAHLIRLRGPERHTSGLGHRIFLGYRFMGTLRAMEKKQSTFLANKEWLDIPWKASSKSPFDKLLDIVVRAPELIKRGDEIGEIPIHYQYQAGVELFKDCSRLYSEIQNFHTSMSSDIEGPLYWSIQVDDIPIRHEFASVDVAATLVMIWAYSLMIKAGLRALSSMLKHFQKMTGQDTAATFDLEDGEDLAGLTDNILLSVAYCIQNSSIEVRSPVIMAPLAIVIDVLKSWPQYQKQYLAARTALESISKMGFKMVWPPIGETKQEPW